MRIDWKNMNTLERRAAVEALIDAQGVAETLNDMAEICNEKASHVDGAWQDQDLATIWDNCAEDIAATADSDSVRQITRYEGR